MKKLTAFYINIIYINSLIQIKIFIHKIRFKKKINLIYNDFSLSDNKIFIYLNNFFSKNTNITFFQQTKQIFYSIIPPIKFYIYHQISFLTDNNCIINYIILIYIQIPTTFLYNFLHLITIFTKLNIYYCVFLIQFLYFHLSYFNKILLIHLNNPFCLTFNNMEIHNYINIPDNLLISSILVYFWLSIIVILLLIPTKFINKMIDNLFFHRLIFIILLTFLRWSRNLLNAFLIMAYHVYFLPILLSILLLKLTLI